MNGTMAPAELRDPHVLTLEDSAALLDGHPFRSVVVMGDSDAKRLEDRLGNVLVKQGKLSKDRLEEALVTQKATLPSPSTVDCVLHGSVHSIVAGSPYNTPVCSIRSAQS